jgi:hypothetical protein
MDISSTTNLHKSSKKNKSRTILKILGASLMSAAVLASAGVSI